MADELEEPTCAVCGRGILRGEHTYDYLNPAGERLEVCELCRSRADAAGWMTPEQAARQPRERPRSGRAAGARAWLVRMRDRSAAALEGRRRRAASPEGEEDAAASEDPAPPAPPAPRSERREARRAQHRPEHRLRRALQSFNAAEQRRTVSGLGRSLGQAQGAAVLVPGGDGGVRITVAWELSWYQWEVVPTEYGDAIREVAKGNEVTELAEADRDWNLVVAGDGSLRLAVPGVDD